MTKLEKILIYASEHSEYYRKIIQDGFITDVTDLNQYPVLTRHQIQKNKHELLADFYHGKHYNSLIKKKSSGSSGTPVTVYWDTNDLFQSTISSWRLRKKYYSTSPSDRQVNFNLRSFEPKRTSNGLEFSETANVLSINKTSLSTELDCLHLYEKMQSFGVEWIYTTPFVLSQLVELVNNNTLPKLDNLKYIECAGEVFTPEFENRVKKLFNVSVANMYGAEETNGIALECPYGNMHIMEDNVYVECLQNGTFSTSGEGEAIVTSLCNRAMPLIRYNLGDIVVIDEQIKCKCGNPHKTIKVVKGRKIDSFVYCNHKTTVYTLMETMNCLNNILGNPIDNYKFIFDNNSQELNVYLKLSEKFVLWKNTVSSELLRILNSKNIFAKNVNVYFESKITPSKEGKFRILEIL